MTISELVELVSAWGGVFTSKPGPSDDALELAWGDTFFFYAPDGEMPQATQPFATFVTKNYPGDASSQLDRDGVFRVNIHPGRESFTEFAPNTDQDAAALDTIIRHPVYGEAGWLAVLNPGSGTEVAVRKLLREAYELDRSRFERRHGLSK